MLANSPFIIYIGLYYYCTSLGINAILIHIIAMVILYVIFYIYTQSYCIDNTSGSSKCLFEYILFYIYGFFSFFYLIFLLTTGGFSSLINSFIPKKSRNNIINNNIK